MSTNLDEMIKSYSDELMRFAKENNIESLAIKKEPEVKEEEIPDFEEVTSEAVQETERESPPQQEEEIMQEPAAVEDMPEQTVEIPGEDDMESFAVFKARVYTALEAFPIEKAKVILYKNDILYAFLVTDINGETKEIKIEAYPEENSREPLNTDQRIDYSADVYADGFTERKGLLVSAVGGSDIVLNVELTPESEAVN